ncbi:MAG: creatininase family protein [Anaerolineales bacterium]
MNLIKYSDLTYPEVADLPRQWPAVIPLGLEQYDYRQVAQALGADSLIALPGVPYGFQQADRSALVRLAVKPGLFRRVMVGIRQELAAQGFQKIYFISGHEDAQLKTEGLNLLFCPYDVQFDPQWPQDLSGRVVVVSTGHTEQHGFHLPLSTDTLIVQALADHLTRLAAKRVYCLPVWPYGVSTHSHEFPGTLNLGGRVFEDFFLAIVDRLVSSGARMIYFSNGHGGNHSFLVNIIKYAGERYPQAFIATEWLHTTGPELQRYRQSTPGGMGHGGELETSYILHLRPDLVHMGQATCEMDFISTPNYHMDWIEAGSLIANPPWSDDTLSGIYGDATLATADKGRLWLQAAGEQKLAIIKEIRDQHLRRRQARTVDQKSNLK